jgi:hypothetical protein
MPKKETCGPGAAAIAAGTCLSSVDVGCGAAAAAAPDDEEGEGEEEDGLVGPAPVPVDAGFEGISGF